VVPFHPSFAPFLPVNQEGLSFDQVLTSIDEGLLQPMSMVPVPPNELFQAVNLRASSLTLLGAKNVDKEFWNKLMNFTSEYTPFGLPGSPTKDSTLKVYALKGSISYATYLAKAMSLNREYGGLVPDGPPLDWASGEVGVQGYVVEVKTMTQFSIDLPSPDPGGDPTLNSHPVGLPGEEIRFYPVAVGPWAGLPAALASPSEQYSKTWWSQ
jgi:hypothetical protein